MRLNYTLTTVVCFFLFFICHVLDAQTISTIAGNNTSSYSGDGGSALSAAIGAPWGVSLDKYGNRYIADGMNNVVRKVNASGIITTVAGNGTPGYSGDGGAATSAQLNYPQAVATDNAGNIYIADDANYVVRKVNTAGIISTFAGTAGVGGYSGDGGAATSAQLYGAIGLAIDKKGNVYISDGNEYVRKVDTSGIISTYAGGTYGYSGDGAAATLAGMANPAGLAIDDTGNLFIADNQNNVIRKVDTFGTISTIAGDGYLAESGGFPPTGAYNGDGGPAILAELNEPFGVAADKWGNIFIGDQSNNVVRKVDATGTITTVAGDGYNASIGYGSYSGDSGLAVNATLNYPAGVAIDSVGHLYIADENNYVIREVQPITIVATGGDTVCSGLPVTFTAASTIGGPLVIYQWKVNGISAGIDNNVFSPDSVSNGDIITCSLLKGADSSYIYGSDAITMTVISTITPAVTISTPSMTECSGSAITFTAVPTGGGASPFYKWHINDSVITGVTGDTLNFMPSPSITATGAYVVKVSLVSSAACASPSDVDAPVKTITIVTPGTPVITISSSGSDTLCSGSSAILSATVTDGGAFPSFQWTVNGVAAGTGSTFTYLPSSGDTVQCILSTTTCSGADTVSSNTIKLTVNPTSTPSVTITASSDTSCSGVAVGFAAFPVNGGSTPVYTWLVNGVSETGTGSTFSYDPANGDTVSCILTSSMSCLTSPTTSSNGILMTVHPSVVPSVTIAADAGDTVCAGSSEYFIASVLNGGTVPAYTWYRNGIDIAIGDTLLYTPVNGDIIRCVLTSSAECAMPDTAASNAIVMVVNPILLPSVSISSTAGASACEGASVTYTATAVNGGSGPTYQWRINGVNVSTGDTYTYVPANGDIVSCLLTSNAPCATPDTAIASVTMTVNLPVTPTVIISGSTGDTVCSGTAVIYTATSLHGGATPGYQWKKNGINVAAGTTYATVPVSGDVISCVLTSTYSCLTVDTAASNTITMSTLPSVIPAISVAESTIGAICVGTPVSYSATATNGGSAPVYAWKVNGVTMASGPTASYVYTPASGDVVICKLTSNATCATPDTAVSATITMTISPAVTPSVTISSAPGTSVCAGTSVTFTATPSNGGVSPLYQWRVNSTDAGTGSSYTYTPASGDIITCVITSDAACLAVDTAGSPSITMTVNADVTPSVSISSSLATVTSTGELVNFVATVVNGGSAPVYQWQINGLSVPGANASTFADSFATADTVTCVIISDAPCASVTAVSSNSIPISVSLGVLQIKQGLTNIVLLPNPNNGLFALTGMLGNSDGPVAFEVTDMLGKIVYLGYGMIKQGQVYYQISLESGVANGMYLMHIRAQNEDAVLHFVVNRP
jgi:hypothetical protein